VGPFVAYGVFVLFVLGLVLFSSFQNHELVEGNPYGKGLFYQARIDQLEHTTQLDSGVVIEPHPATGTLTVRFPGIVIPREVSGGLRLMRPSNACLDRYWPLALDASGVQEISIAGLARGAWWIELDWKVDSVGYYYRTRLMIP
jgi:hypothetical protein